MRYQSQSQNGYYQKVKKECVGEDVEKREPCALLVGLTIGAATLETSMEIPQKPKHRSTI